MIPAPVSCAGGVQMASAPLPQVMPLPPPYGVPGQIMRPYAPMPPNGYHAMPQPASQGAMIHPGGFLFLINLDILAIDAAILIAEMIDCAVYSVQFSDCD